MPFRPLRLPLDSGASQDFSPHGVTGRLESVQNGVFTRKGSITGRPGLVTNDEDAQVAPADGVSGPLSAAVTGLLPAGVVTVNAPGGERALALWQGAQYLHTGSAWLRTGTGATTRKRVSPALGTMTLERGFGGSGGHLSPIPVGTSVVGLLGPGLDNGGIPFLGYTGEILYRGTASTANIDAAAQANMAAAGNALFYHTTAGDVRAHIPGTLPATTDVLISTGTARTDTDPMMNVAAVADAVNGSGYFVAWVSATAGRISLRRLNTAGSVVATLDVNGLGTVVGCALALDPSGRLFLVYIDSATGELETRYFTTSTTAITDAGSLGSFPGASVTGEHSFSFTVGVGHNDQPIIAMLNTDGELEIWLQSGALGSWVQSVTLVGDGTNADGVSWEPLFAPLVLNSTRTVIGVQRVAPTYNYTAGTTDYNVGQSQWLVLDLTYKIDKKDEGDPTDALDMVLAHGEWRGNGRSKPSTAALTESATLAFGLWEGVAFDTLGTETVRAVRISLELSPAAASAGGGLLASANAVLFDGAFTYQHPFPETFPDIIDVFENTGGTLVAGSYTYQATWETVNARGQIIRSGASLPATITVIAPDAMVQVTVTVPQLRPFRLNNDTTVVKLWATQVDPTSAAPLYLIATTVVTTSASVVLNNDIAPVGSEEQLYTVGDVFDDAPPPAGDRGVAFAIDRMWVADQRNVFASKLLSTRFAPAWNTEGVHTVTIPNHLGEIQGLAGFDDRLVVVCSNGIAIVRGPGVDDLGNGPGWATDIYPGHGAGDSHPRRVLATPDGVVYEGRGGNLWMVDTGGNVARINTAVSLEAVSGSGDLSYGGGVTETLASADLTFEPRRLYHGSQSSTFVYDLEVGQWVLWTLPDGLYHTTVGGVLWLQCNAGDLLVLSGEPGADAIRGTSAPITLRIATTQLQPTEMGLSGWGRLKKLQLQGPVPEVGEALTIDAYVLGDDSRPLLDDSEVYTPVAEDGLWPRQAFPEFTTSVQRCRTFSLALDITPATVELTSVDFWVSGDGSAPNNNRG